MTKPGDRARALAAAGIPVHQHSRAPGVYMRNGTALCGARWDKGAEFTTWSKYVTCVDCKALIAKRRAKAKATFAAISGALALLLMVGCGDAAESASVAGAWSYAWPVPGQTALHGTMTLTEGAGVVTGTVGVPVEVADTDAAPDWDWTLAAAVTGDRVECSVRGSHSDAEHVWRWDLTLTGDTMAGPTYSPADVPQATFSAVRQ